MERLVKVLDDGNNPSGCSFNFYYYHLLMQVSLYYPNVEQKIAAIFDQNIQLWKSAIQQTSFWHTRTVRGRNMPGMPLLKSPYFS